MKTKITPIAISLTLDEIDTDSLSYDTEIILDDTVVNYLIRRAFKEELNWSSVTVNEIVNSEHIVIEDIFKEVLETIGRTLKSKMPINNCGEHVLTTHQRKLVG